MRAVLAALPSVIREAVLARGVTRLAEIHLRGGRRASLCYYRGGLCVTEVLSCVLTDEELHRCLAALCGGSVYAHAETLKEGFLSLEGGVRVGVCGRAVTKEGRITAIAEVNAIVFRLPHAVMGVADALVAHIRATRRGLLIYGPPGVGKTTLLRELARELSRGASPMRCAVIDARGELGSFGEECMVDVLSGYPKAKGAEIAVRTLTPEVLILDEIGAEEAEGLLRVASMGVITVASAHGECLFDLEARPPLAALLLTGMFGALYRVGDEAPVRYPPIACENGEGKRS